MAISVTPNHQFPYPEPGSGEPNNVPLHIKALAEKLDSDLSNTMGTEAETPGTPLRDAVDAFTRPNVLTCQVAADGVTDDRATINNFLSAIPDDDQEYTVHFTGGSGRCLISAGPVSGGMSTGVIVPRSNINLIFPPGGGLYSTVADMRLLIISGMALATPADPFLSTSWITYDTVVNLTGTVAAGATSITLDTPTHGLVAGDDIFIRTGNLASGGTREPDAELNKVKSVAGAVITLERPTKSAYAQEYFVTGTTGLTTTTVTANPAPFGVVKVTGRIIKNVYFDGQLHADAGAASTAEAATIYQAAHIRFGPNTDVRFGKYGINARFAYDVSGPANRIPMFTVGSTDTDPAFLAPSTGCGLWDFRTIETGYSAGKTHLHEGVYQTHFDILRRCPDSVGAASKAAISHRSRGYQNVIRADIEGVYTHASAYGVKADGDLYIERLRLRGAPGLGALSVDDGSVRINPAGLDLPAAASVSHAASVDPLAETILLNASAFEGYVAGGLGPPSKDVGTQSVGPGWLFDAAQSEYAHAALEIPATWRRWQVEITSAATTVPVGGSDVGRWQPSVIDAATLTTVASTQASATYVTQHVGVTTTHTTSFTTTGRHRLLVARLGAAGTDTYTADARLLSVRIRRLA